jgi:GNAT superfamily N-acetyltransferase
MRTKAVVRCARAEDVSRIIPLWQELINVSSARDPHFRMRPDAVTDYQALLSEHLDKEDRLLVVADLDDEIVGYSQSVIDINPPTHATHKLGRILSTSVQSKFRRKGIGENMINYAVRWLETRGISRIEVSYSVMNKVSGRFWKKMGFQPHLTVGCRDLKEEQVKAPSLMTLCGEYRLFIG